MKSIRKYLPYIVLATMVVVLLLVQCIFGNFPLWFFAAPMNLLVGALWLMAIWECFRHRKMLATVQYMLSAEAAYVALLLLVVMAVVLGLQREPVSTSWFIVGGFVYVLTVLSFVILRGWRNARGVRWRFLITHLGLWLAVVSAFLGAPDKQVLRVEVGDNPTREAVNEQGEFHFLDYDLRLIHFDMEQSDGGAPKRFCATVAIDDEEVDIEVNRPYSYRYGEDIYLVSYSTSGCMLQIVREPWRAVTAAGVVMLLIGAMMLFLQGFQKRV